MAQLSHPYRATGRNIALAVQTFADRLMPLLLNMLSRLVIAFLPRSRCLLISWLQSLSTVQGWIWTQNKAHYLGTFLHTGAVTDFHILMWIETVWLKSSKRIQPSALNQSSANCSQPRALLLPFTLSKMRIPNYSCFCGLNLPLFTISENKADI